MTLLSSYVARASALVLAALGLSLLFAADDILPRVVPGFPGSASWLGQLLGAGWLAIAALNWFTRSTLLGGIYGRQIVVPNVTLYFVSAMALLKAGVWMPAAPAVLFAVVYGWLLFRGPFARDFARSKP